MKKIFAIFLAALMVFDLMGCKNNLEDISTSETAEDSLSLSDGNGTASGEAEADNIKVTANTPLAVGVDSLSDNTCPLMTEGYDENIIELTQLMLLSHTRSGAIVLDGIRGETESYEGTEYTYYGPAEITLNKDEDNDDRTNIVIKLREDLKFSDGTAITADDIIFTLYTFADPSYEGESTLGELPVVGMKEYRAGVDKLYNLLMKAGRDNTDYKYWDESTQTAFWAEIDEAGAAYAKQISDYCIKNYSDYAETYIGATADAVRADELLQIKLGMFLWGFGDYWKEGATAADFFAAMYKEHNGDLELLDELEGQEGIDSFFTLMPNYESYQKTVLTDGVSAISGIKKISDYEIQISISGQVQEILEALCLPILSLDYYGNRELYNIEESSFGFAKGDISSVLEFAGNPLGAGAYVLEANKDGEATLSANTNYFLGVPKTAKLTLRAYDSDSKMMSALKKGEIFIAEAECSEQTTADNDYAVCVTYPCGKYGCIGISAERVCVGAKDSAESKALRGAFATVFAAYRSEAIAAFYADRAKLIEYPISSVTYGAPAVEDEGYACSYAFKGDSTTQKFRQSLITATLNSFEAAGYISADGKISAAPDGASLTYTAYVCAGGTGGHPAYKIFTDAAEILAEIGITLEIKDIENSAELWSGLYDGTIDIWAEDWDAQTNPGLRQLYFGDAANDGESAGSANYLYKIEDEDIDNAISLAENSYGQEYRTAVKSVMDGILSWSVKVPVYERSGLTLFSAKHISGSVPVLTLHHDWTSEAGNISLK